MRMLPCCHRLRPEEESFCWLESSLNLEEGPALVFRGEEEGRPARCTASLAAVCPFREWTAMKEKAAMVSCPHCQGRHRNGSNSQQLCEAWSATKSALARLRRELPEGHRFFKDGTTVPPYEEGTTPLIRRLVWQRLQPAILRRDRYRCQDCGVDFGARRRKVFDPKLRRGKGGYRWESLEVHHIIARSNGGSDHPGNLKTLCPACHSLYTLEQTAIRTADRKERAAMLRALEDAGYGDEGLNDPMD
ncbi:MAG: HNH endonuclease [Methanomassiliicoccus sp.]|nr:HNH endonuclease [Methanomassiliicoccus sp.]